MDIDIKKSYKEPTIDFVFLIIRLLLAIIFISSGITKLLDVYGFVQIVTRFMILPEIIIPYFAIILPIIELFLGLCLISGLYFRRIIRYLLVLLSIFILVIAVTIIRGISVNCGCFGGLFDDIIGFKTLARNFFLLGLLIVLSTRKKLMFSIQ